ncbi:hypothetical protein BXZ70DRAFT_928537 [Cristinia sonorae]|uniref:LCCL domain-containing protein n=1 Tax=Cristinia sonorae TaxID=1940300 RepID=A0A8K0UTT3_9AGAR|nr:hypothetical protein BXZ70DRAFT_928537 [Cristinia sonorae]
MERGRASESSSTFLTCPAPDVNVQTLDYYPPTSPPEQQSKPQSTTSLQPVEVADAEEQRPSVPWYEQRARRFGSQHPRLSKVWHYFRGPRPKRDLAEPTPFLTFTFHSGRRIALESAWIRLTRRFTAPWLFCLLAIGYIIGFAFFSRTQSFLVPAESFIGCTSTYWLANDGCGLDGQACGPFDFNSSFDFRCPAQCKSVILQNPRTVGDEQTAFVPLIVGGGDENRTYRGDTFICAAAIQDGLISNSKGGCATVQVVANFTDFLPFTANGLTSIGFPTIFPVGFRLRPTNNLSSCSDLRNPALAFNVLITALIFLVLRPRPIIAFWCLVCIGFWHVSLFSQPQSTPPPLDTAFAIFLPALFVSYAYWRLAFRFVLPIFSRMPLEGTVWYLGPFWVGVLSNVVFDKIPISRLTASDITQRKGGIIAFVIILIVLVCIAVNQVRVIRKTGWLPYYLRWYIIGGLVILVLSQLPGLELRLHHYIFATALMPGTAFPTRLSAIYQGLLLGIFLNGVAAFGFASILQTSKDLRRDAPLGSALPSFRTNATNYNSSVPLQNQTIFWDALVDDSWDGFALLIDDVERYVGTALNYSLASLQTGLPHFFRLAYTSGGQTADFTKAATLWPNGTWVDPPPGPS